MMEIKFISMVLLLFFVRAIRTLTIEQILVPSYYLVNDKSEPLILECDFNVDTTDIGFVLKWHYNSFPIYQWIPGKKPFALGAHRGRIDTNYEVSGEPSKKHSALSIINPTISDTGNYTCDVQSFTSGDRKTSQMIVVHPETSINLKYEINETSQIVNLNCTVHNIYPYPEIKFLFEEEEKTMSIDVEQKVANNLFNVTITAQISKNDISDDSPVTCWIKINETDYEKKETIVYDDPKQTSTTKKTNDEDNMSASQFNAENSGTLAKSHLGILIIALLNLLVLQRFL